MQVKNNNVLIQKYRQQLMGIAAIGVLFVHANGIVPYPYFVALLFSYGGIGVYIFVFLSAIGLYRSLNVLKRNKSDFFKRRFIRVFIPYFLIAGTWYGIKYLIFEKNALNFFYEISTLSFWIEHKGAWYIAMLVPVYLVFPWFYDWTESGSRNKKIIRCTVIVSALSVILSIAKPELFNHLSRFLGSVIVYLIGYYEAEKVENGTFKGTLLSTVSVLLHIVILCIPPLKQNGFTAHITWAMLSIPILLISAKFLDKINCASINSFFGFFGKHSLELYLWNIFTIQMLEYFNIADLLKSLGVFSGYIAYGIVLFVGIILSIIYEKLSSRIQQRLMRIGQNSL